METYAARLEKARRKVAEQELLVAVYKETIKEFEHAGQPDELGQKMLQLMENVLTRLRADLAQHSN